MADDIESQNPTNFLGYIRSTPPDFVEVGTIPIQGKNYPYMNCVNRMKWAFSEWEKMMRHQAEAFIALSVEGIVSADDLAKRLSNMGWKIFAKIEKIEVIRNEDHIITADSYAVASCYIRDPLGNETSEWAMVTQKQWPAFVEKALTKAKARALQNLAFGTAFAIDMEDDEDESIRRDPSNMADTASPRTERPVAATQPKTTPTPASMPKSAPLAPTATQTATPANPRNTPGLKGKSREYVTRLTVLYPKFVGWVASTKFGYKEGDFRDVAYEIDAAKLKLNQDNWLAEFREYLAGEGTTPERILEKFKDMLASQGKTYGEWAAEQGVTIEVPTPVSATAEVSEATFEAAAAEEDFNEETDAPIAIDPEYDAFTKLGGDKLRPRDPESPTKEQWTRMKAVVDACGGAGNSKVVDVMRSVQSWYEKDMRKEYLDEGNPAHQKPSMISCYTVRNVYDVMKALEKLQAQRDAA